MNDITKNYIEEQIAKCNKKREETMDVNVAAANAGMLQAYKNLLSFNSDELIRTKNVANIEFPNVVTEENRGQSIDHAIAELTERVTVIKATKKRIQRVESALHKTIKGLKDEREALNNLENIKVSDHAIVRYFERVQGVDTDKIRKDILTNTGRRTSEVLPEFRTAYKVCIHNKEVKTIV